MDRNFINIESLRSKIQSLSARRAWIEISTVIVILRKRDTSLSARRAWIEIYFADRDCDWVRVALRKESVDRNFMSEKQKSLIIWSLSARRAWIEIFDQAGDKTYLEKSLSARRAWIEIST